MESARSSALAGHITWKPTGRSEPRAWIGVDVPQNPNRLPGRVFNPVLAARSMPAALASGDHANIALGIVRRTGQTLTAAVHPVWGTMSVDDIYTDSASATRHFTVHVLVGDKVLLVQPSAFAMALFKVA